MQQDILYTLAPEVMLHVLSFMPLTEVYRIRYVCKLWQIMAEEHIFMSIRASKSTVDITIGSKSNSVCITLIPHSYDSQNRTIEFVPAPSSVPLVPMTADPSNPWSACHRHMQIRFSQWSQWESRHAALIAIAKDSALQQLHQQHIVITPSEKALIRFHLDYNPSCERVYELPQWCNSNSLSQASHYVGDKSMILSMAYVQRPSNQSSPPSSPYYYGFHPASTSSAPGSSQPPHIKICWLRVTLSWILSGIKPEIAPVQIYPNRYARLSHALARHGCFKYDPLSEPILAHIVEDEDEPAGSSLARPLSPASSISSAHSAIHHIHPQFPTVYDIQQPTDSGLSSTADNDNASRRDVTPELLEYVQAHTHECHTRLSRLQHVLEGAGVDARVLWKYTFAKNFVVGSGSLLGEEDVVRRIQDSEEEWCRKRISIFRRLGTTAGY